MTRPLRFLAFLAGLALAVSAMGVPSFAEESSTTESQSGETRTGATAPAAQPASPTIDFVKVFKSSTPEYVKITVDQHGTGTYDIRQLDDDSHPQPCDVSAALAGRIFSLAAELHDFDGVQLEVRRRVANLGQKTFRYENGAESHEVTFNYTLNNDANKLLEIFEGLSLQLQYVDQLKRSMRYDPLGLNDVLRRLQSDLDQGLLSDPPALVPLLRKISADQRYLDIARQRAELIANNIASGHGS